MTLGVVPRWAETGYGYLELGAELNETAGVRQVRRFVEKPSAAKAAEFVASGRYLWNAGIFVFRGTTLLELLARWVPELAAGLERIAREPEAVGEIYPTLPADSIDYALMEKLDSIATLPLDCGWSDLGSWAALHEVLPHDGDGNALRGDALALDASGRILLVANADNNTVTVLTGNGLGAFTSRSDYGTASVPSSIVSGDLNRDGRLDLTVAAAASNVVSVLLGTGGQVYLDAPPKPRGLPSVLAMAAPSPNPTRTASVIGFTLPNARAVWIDVLDLAGRHVRTLRSGGVMSAGEHSVVWDGGGDHGAPVRPGVYLVKVRAGDEAGVRKVVRVE